MQGVPSLGWILLLLAFGGYAAAVKHLDSRHPDKVAPELLITLPRGAQIAFAAGDRHLAANLAGFRVLVADTGRMRAQDYAVQARLQRDVAWFNPAHEDNYYIAANILPWGGQVDAAEEILRRAVEARPMDFLPAFHVGFIHYHFRRNPAEGARWLQLAAQRTEDKQDQWGLQVVAAKWIEHGYEAGVAANIVGAMANSAPPGGFRTYLGMRAQRLRALVTLREAVQLFRQRHSRFPASLEDLVVDGLIARVPEDPLGVGYMLRPDGEPVFAAR